MAQLPWDPHKIEPSGVPRMNFYKSSSGRVSDKDQTLGGRVWIKFRLLVSRIHTLVGRCGILGGVESVVVMTLRDCSI